MKVKRYETLIQEVAKRQPSTILEIGTWKGINAAKMINEAKKHRDDIKYYGFDLFNMNLDMKQKEFHTKHNATKAQAEKNIRDTGVNYELIVGNTIETLKNFYTVNKIDFIFIDGGHSLDTIESDWSNVKRLIDDHSVVIFDDYYHNRKDVGCKVLIDSLDRFDYAVSLLGPKDIIADLEISLAKVQLLA